MALVRPIRRTAAHGVGGRLRGVARVPGMIECGSVRAHSSHRDAVNRPMAGLPTRLVRAWQQPCALDAQRNKEGHPAPRAQHGFDPPGSRVATGGPVGAQTRPYGAHRGRALTWNGHTLHERFGQAGRSRSQEHADTLSAEASRASQGPRALVHRR